MLFNSVTYIIFLPICVLCYYLLPGRYRNIFLLGASYFFYMCWMPQYALLIGFSTVATWICGWLVEKAKKQAVRKLSLAVNITVNLGILFLFKYLSFFEEILGAVFHKSIETPAWNLLLPVGISFYTFQALGYSIDVYRRKIHHERNLINYAVFVSFFPQLVAGPIERSANLLPQFREQHRFSKENMVKGLRIILCGMYKKIVIADMLALFVDYIFSNYEQYMGLTLILAIFLFTIQIYCDFSGYSDVARGSALMFGIRLMDNFNAPYFSTSIKEFWNRWHISLSSWFRDYVYIPLGGNRKGFVRKLINVFIIFILSGLWHGAAWTFVIWGALHGLYRVCEELINRYRRKHQVCGKIAGRWQVIVKTFMVFLIVMFTWTFFRAENFGQAEYFFLHYFREIGFTALCGDVILIVNQLFPYGSWIHWGYVILMMVSVLILAILDYMCKNYQVEADVLLGKGPLCVRWFFYYGITILVMFSFIMTTNEYGQAGAFLYFQF